MNKSAVGTPTSRLEREGGRRARAATSALVPLLALVSGLCLIGGLAEPGARAACAHIDVLSKAEADRVVADDYKGSAMSPGPSQKWTVDAAGALMTPLVCQAVRRVAFFDQDLKKNDGLAGRTDRRTADLLQMSAANFAGLASELLLRLPGDLDDDRARVPQDVRKYELARGSAELARVGTMQAILHEAAHAADYLLRSESVETGVGAEATWDAAARAFAREAIARNLLNVGLREEWERIHGAFVDAGMAVPYHGKGQRSGLAAAALVSGGFMSGYGGDKVTDDIAEMTAWALVSEAYVEKARVAGGGEGAARRDLACEAMQREAGPSIPTRLAAVYAKVGFLQAVGFISDDAYRKCVGKLRMRGKGPGFLSFLDGKLSRTYDDSITRRIGQVDGSGPYLFEMTAEGTVDITDEKGNVTEADVPSRIVLRLDVSPAGLFSGLDEVSYPRGVYHVGEVHGRHNRLRIVRIDNGKTLMEVACGVALVGRASRELIEGSVFVERTYNFAGGLLSSIAGHEPVSAETSFTFRFVR